MDWNGFCYKVSHILHIYKNSLLFDYDDEQIIYTIASQKYVYTKEEYNAFMENVEKCDFKRYSICDGNTYEAIVHLPEGNARRYSTSYLEDKLAELIVKDEEAKITYFFEGVSEKLVWYIIKDYDIDKKIYMRLSTFMFDRRCENLKEKNLFQLLKMIMRIPPSICIRSDNIKSREQFQKYAKSFLFNMAYNFDFVFKPVVEFEDLFPQRIPLNKKRIHNITELMAPQLSYKEELVEQYYMALLSQNPFVQFIGFYHIMEHFYEEVYNEDMFVSVQHIIQHPGFSVKRTKDIVKIVELIKKKTRQGKEEFQGSELEALELTLKKFVDISELRNDLMEFKDSLIEYYKNSEVSFSSGDAVDLMDDSNEKTYKKLATRIYKTRNALVHNKSNENRLSKRGVYKVFNDSQELSMEIPLMRYISEAIIIHSASSL